MDLSHLEAYSSFKSHKTQNFTKLKRNASTNPKFPRTSFMKAAKLLKEILNFVLEQLKFELNAALIMQFE